MINKIIFLEVKFFSEKLIVSSHVKGRYHCRKRKKHFPENADHLKTTMMVLKTSLVETEVTIKNETFVLLLTCP